MELNSLTFLSWYKHFKSDGVKLTHFPVMIQTGKWVSLTPSLLKCLYQDRKVSEFISVSFEMFVSRQESERVYLRHFWNVCIKTGKWVSLTPSLLKCFVSIQESERLNSLTFLSWYKHFKSDGDKLAHFPVLIQTFQK
jgi:hypothetical protein